MLPRCPSCREPLAPKNLEVTCGSCGNKFNPPFGGPQTRLLLYAVCCLAGLILLVVIVFENAADERSRLEAEMDQCSKMLKKSHLEMFRLTKEQIWSRQER